MTANSTSDVVVLGGGPGGYVAAIRAAQLGLQVTLVEKEALGGICLNWGCIPTKSLLRNAEVISLLQQGDLYGFTFRDLQVDYSAAVDRSRQVVDRMQKGIASLMRKHQIRVLEGVGRLVSPREVVVTPNQGAEAIHIHARAIIVATGGRARTLPGVEVDGDRVMHFRHALAMRALPRSMVIIGAGPIGVEFASIWRAYGVDVTLVEMMPHLLPLEDEEVARELERAFRRRQVRVLTSARVEAVNVHSDGVQVSVQKEGGEKETLQAEKVLVAIGIQPNTEGIGLQECGVALDRGWVVVDEHMRTTVPGIWAVGDVTGKLPLAHVASAQGILAAEDIAGQSPLGLDYEAMPRCVYTSPQVASFGLTETQARERGYNVQVGRFPFIANGKAVALEERSGFVKLVVDRASGWLLGAHLVGPEVTELVSELVLARTAELVPEIMVRAVHPHPTLSETLSEAVRAALGQALHA
ncbi:MAG: dihydrolipoyl dehydrogenase [Anaerolineae bacterium]|nr:dihydrolipoyl dehydrogenase [Anaerolineae bacterium]MDW8068285.1 dihydrolipoyl dehydrogenase [Anaerolineae bacterium]